MLGWLDFWAFSGWVCTRSMVRAASAPTLVMLPSASYVGRLIKDTIGRVDMSQPNQGRYEAPHANFDTSLKPVRTSRAAAVSVYGSEHMGSPKMISTIV